MFKQNILNSFLIKVCLLFCNWFQDLPVGMGFASGRGAQCLFQWFWGLLLFYCQKLMNLFLYNKNNFLKSSLSGHLLSFLICSLVIIVNITKAALTIFTVEGMISFSHLFDLNEGGRRGKKLFFPPPLTSRSLRQTRWLQGGRVEGWYFWCLDI